VTQSKVEVALGGEDCAEGITIRVGELRRLIDALPGPAEVLVEINDSGLLSGARARVGLGKWLGHDAVPTQPRFVQSAAGAVRSRPEDGEALVISGWTHAK
jgi:hypothetical protein